MDALKDLFDNEKAIMALGILFSATVLVALGSMTVDQWTDLAKWIYGFYAAGTAVYKGAVAISKRNQVASPTPPPSSPPQ